jgi:ABC-type bacteriocin/lantibiotic exporter with double-glycine peptidase domain
VGSEAAIFDDTVANNVRLGMESSLGDVRAACQLARVSEFVKEMESGYETRLQYQGRNLSAGQRQRIAIARALLRKPDVLILDESTNALDKSTQEQLVEDILREYKDRIVVFITHDPAIMTRVDHVIDLSPGPAALEAVPPRPGDAPGAPPPPKG